MSQKSKYIFAAILTILKNATILIPLIEGVVSTIYSILHPTEEKKGEENGKQSESCSDSEFKQCE